MTLDQNKIYNRYIKSSKLISKLTTDQKSLSVFPLLSFHSSSLSLFLIIVFLLQKSNVFLETYKCVLFVHICQNL